MCLIQSIQLVWHSCRHMVSISPFSTTVTFHHFPTSFLLSLIMFFLYGSFVSKNYFSTFIRSTLFPKETCISILHLLQSLVSPCYGMIFNAHKKFDFWMVLALLTKHKAYHFILFEQKLF
jgi:hypothetical protein